MYSTYKLMSNCTNDRYLNKSLEDLCEDYKATESVSKRNKIIAAMFIKVFPMILKIQSKYFTLTNEQKIDHALFHLIRSIKYYKNNNVKFSSFYHVHLTNQMKSLLTHENNNKNAVFQNIVPDNDLKLKLYSSTKLERDEEDTEKYFLQNLETSLFLSKEEKDYIACVVAGYEKNKQVHEKFNAKKIKDYLTTPEDLVKLNKFEQSELRKIKKIKKSIIEKYSKYGDRIFY